MTFSGWLDTALAITMGVSVLLSVASAAEASETLPRTAWLAVFGVAVATALFRSAPLMGLLVGTTALLGYHVTVGEPIGLAWPLAVVAYGVARAGHLWLGVGFAGAYLGAVFAHRLLVEMAIDGVALLHHAAQEVLLLLGALLVGEVVRTRAQQAETARTLLALHRQQQEHHTQRRIIEERLRIARDLHDLTAHTVSVISLHAGAARERFDHDPEAARTSLVTIHEASKQAARELRGLVGLLRSDEVPSPDVRDTIQQAVARARSAGVTVDLRFDPPALALAGPVGIAVARIVQESLTNVLRHAKATHARVHVYEEAGTVNVVVTDDGVGPQWDGSVPQPGFGLRGMRERVEALGGTLTYGRGDHGGFMVHARLGGRSHL